MEMRIGEWGGSFAIRLPNSVVDSLKLEKGQSLEVHIANGALMLTPKQIKPSLDMLCTLAQTQTPPNAETHTPLTSEWSHE